MDIEKAITKNTAILGVCFIIGLSIVSLVLLQIKAADNALSVTGSAKQTVQADTVKWTATFSRTVYASQLNQGYEQMKKDEQIVAKFFKDNGISDEEIAISPVSMQKQYYYEKNQNSVDEYTLQQNVLVTSKNIDKIKTLSKDVSSIISQGVLYSAYSPEYYYTNLPEMRVSLLPEAMKDAQKRAESIAQSTGKKVGALKSASMGVVQVMQPNSVEISDYGNYDLSTVEKEVMITVKASFTLK
jgi:hypothetical protein